MQFLTQTISTDLPTARHRLEAALQDEGFGVLTEIDLQKTFDAKLGESHEAHQILGVCNPRLAKDALEVSRDVALLLPCTATLRDVGGATEIRILDPEHAFTLADEATRAKLSGLAHDARDRLAAALEALA